MRRVLGWAFVAALLGATGLGERPEAPTASPLLRLLGPAAPVASDVQWIRFRYALTAGDHARAIALAETAIELDPTDTRGWDLLAAWLRAGLDTAERGEAVADDPAALALVRGIMLQTHAELDPDLAWEGGTRELWRGAAQAYALAATRGIEAAKDAMRYAEEQARVE
jgi:hypothetical protein